MPEKASVLGRLLTRSEVTKRAKAVQRKRTKRAREMDGRRSAVNVIGNPTERTMRKWERNPGRYDLRGVDDGERDADRDRAVMGKYKRETAKKRATRYGTDDMVDLLEDERADEFDGRRWRSNGASTVESMDDYQMNHREAWDPVYSERCRPRTRKAKRTPKSRRE